MTTVAPNKHQPSTRAPFSFRVSRSSRLSERLYAREITYIFNGHAWLFAGTRTPFDFTAREMFFERRTVVGGGGGYMGRKERANGNEYGGEEKGRYSRETRWVGARKNLPWRLLYVRNLSSSRCTHRLVVSSPVTSHTVIYQRTGKCSRYRGKPCAAPQTMHDNARQPSVWGRWLPYAVHVEIALKNVKLSDYLTLYWIISLYFQTISLLFEVIYNSNELKIILLVDAAKFILIM